MPAHRPGLVTAGTLVILEMAFIALLLGSSLFLVGLFFFAEYSLSLSLSLSRLHPSSSSSFDCIAMAFF